MKAPHLLQQFVRSLLDRSSVRKRRSRQRLCGFEPLEPRMVLSAAMPLFAGGNSALHRNDWRHVEAKSQRSEAAELAQRPSWASAAALRSAVEKAQRTPRHEAAVLPVARSEPPRSEVSLERAIAPPASLKITTTGEGEAPPLSATLSPPLTTPTLRSLPDTSSSKLLAKPAEHPLERLTTSTLGAARESQDAPPIARPLESPVSAANHPTAAPANAASTLTVLGPIMPATLVISVPSAAAPHVIVPVSIPVTIQLTYSVPASVSRPQSSFANLLQVVHSVAIQPAFSLIVSRPASGRSDGPAASRTADASLFTADYAPTAGTDQTAEADFVSIDESSSARQRKQQATEAAVASEDQPLETSPDKTSDADAVEDSGMIELESDGVLRQKRKAADRSASAALLTRLTPLAELPLVQQAEEVLRELLRQAAHDTAIAVQDSGRTENAEPIVDDGLIEVLAADVGRQALPGTLESTERAASLEAGAALYQAFEIDIPETDAPDDTGPGAISQVAVSLHGPPAARSE